MMYKKLVNMRLRDRGPSNRYYRTGMRESLFQVQIISINIRLKLIQYNWLMRTYVTHEKLNKFNRNIPDTCIKCESKRGTTVFGNVNGSSTLGQ